MTSLLWAHPFILPHYLECFPFPVKGSRQAILFAYADGTLMLRREFDAILKRLLEFCGLSSKVLRVLVSEWEQPRQTRKLEQRVDGFQMLSAETFVYRKVLHTDQAVLVSNLGKGGL